MQQLFHLTMELWECSLNVAFEIFVLECLQEKWEGLLPDKLRMVLDISWMLLTQPWRCSQESLKPEIVLDKTLPQITLLLRNSHRRESFKGRE